MKPRECICAHQRAAHHKTESTKVSPSDAGKLSKIETSCARCYCTQFKAKRRMPSKLSTAATLTKFPGRTLYRRSGLGRKLPASIPVDDGEAKSGTV
jgi:hypothetical protein